MQGFEELFYINNLCGDSIANYCPLKVVSKKYMFFACLVMFIVQYVQHLSFCYICLRVFFFLSAVCRSFLQKIK